MSTDKCVEVEEKPCPPKVGNSDFFAYLTFWGVKGAEVPLRKVGDG